MTLFRMHPVDLLLTSVSVTFFQAVAYGGFYFLTASEPQMASIFGLNVVLFGFYLLGYNLRHTHIWLNFPVWLSKILVSPAQHQIHHSSDPKHFDRNMGLIFSFWDQLFKTHYIPREREQLSYGLSRDEPSPFQSISEIYFKPFRLAYGQLRQGFSTMSRRLVLYASATLLTCVVALAFQKPGGEPGLPSVKLADLTWTEVHSAIERGYRTVIRPDRRHRAERTLRGAGKTSSCRRPDQHVDCRKTRQDTGRTCNGLCSRGRYCAAAKRTHDLCRNDLHSGETVRRCARGNSQKPPCPWFLRKSISWVTAAATRLHRNALPTD